MPFSISVIRRQFPFLRTAGLVYLDSAASAQKPSAVIDAMTAFDRDAYANVHRGMYPRSERATEMFERSRTVVQRFLGAAHADEIIFTKNATEALNLVVRSLGTAMLRKGDAVALSILEHHSNIVPWLQLQEQCGIEIVWIGLEKNGELSMEELVQALKKKNVKLVSVTGQSNVLGVRPRLKEIIDISHRAGALVMVDAAQLAAHHPIDVTALDCDFLAITGHKLYGPTGIGALYGKRNLLATMPPFLGGGMMIAQVQKRGFLPADPPQKFEAGTPPISQAIGLAAAIEWMQETSWKDIEAHEQHLIETAYETLASVPDLRIIGAEDPSKVSGCVSFTIDGIHPHDLCDLLGQEGICLRAGHHCTEPLHTSLGIAASARLSVGIYNTEKEVRSVGPAIRRAIKKMSS